jgi:hypothetical protein
MQRRSGNHRKPFAAKRPMLPPKRALRPALKPQARVMHKQHRGGR